MADMGDAYMPIVNPAVKIPTKVSFIFPWKARRVAAIIAPTKRMFNIAINFTILT